MAQVERFYNEKAEEEWARLDRHRTEQAVTLLALSEHLPPPPAALADIGGGPGRYAIELARRGYAVTLVDLAQANVDLAQVKTAELGVKLTAYVQGDARDLPLLDGSTFDAVLLLGPLYHLLTEADRRQAVAEAQRILRPGGLLAATFITRFAPFRSAATGYPDWYTSNLSYAEHVLASGVHDLPMGFTEAYFAHPQDVTPFMEAQGLETVALIGCEGIVAGHEALINDLEGPAWDRWVELNYRLGHESSLHGAADHLLYLGRKAA